MSRSVTRKRQENDTEHYNQRSGTETRKLSVMDIKKGNTLRDIVSTVTNAKINALIRERMIRK
jgi:hypothetical protein